MKERIMEERYGNLKTAEQGARLSIIAYVFLSAIKLGVGYWSGSKALVADGLNNSTDIVASLAVLIGLKIACKPADEDHAYGHFRAETIASLVASLIMIAIGADVLYHAVRGMLYFKPEPPDPIAAVTALFCALVIYLVYRYNRKMALQINSAGLMAAAKDNLSDAWVSLGAAIGIIASQFGMPWIDPLAAVIVGLLIVKTGWDIFVEATNNLTDGYNKDKIDKISARLKSVPGVCGISAVRARLHGNVTLMDLIILVDPEITVKAGHDISEAVEKVLHEEYSITEVITHVEPFTTSKS